MNPPKIKVHRFDDKLWVSLEDHKAEIQRYKDALALAEKNSIGSLAKSLDVFFNGRKA